MILGHSFISHPIDIHNLPWCVSLHNWIYSFHMELFFLLSGCVYKCIDYKKYVSKKTDRILVPYLFFGSIAMLLHSSGSELINRSYSLSDGIINLFLYGGSYWFLYTLYFLLLIYPIIERILRESWMEIGFAVICVLSVEFLRLPVILTINRVIYYIPFFIMGRYLVKLLQYEKAKSHWVNILLFITALIAFIVSDCLSEIYPEVALIKYIGAFAMIFVVYVPAHYLILLEDCGNRIACLLDRFLSNCSKYSLQLYLFNGFILVAIRTAVVSLLHIHNPLVIVTSIVAGNLIITLLICNYVLPHIKWLSWLCGTGRNKS